MKKFAFRVLLALLLLSMLAQPFSAAEVRRGSITLEYSHSGENFADQPVSLYRVAEVTPEGECVLLPPFDSFPVNLNGITSNKEWQEVADTLVNYIVADQIQPDSVARTNEEGVALFPALDLGVYLVGGVTADREEGYYEFENFCIFLPTPQEDGTHDHDVEAKPKSEFVTWPVKPETVVYRVTKVWKDTGNRNSRPVQITVDLLKDGVVQRPVVLNAGNNWTYQWEAGAGEKWSVVERDVPDDYKVVITENGTAFQITNTYTAEIEVPKTGDTAALWLYVLAMCLSGLGLLLIAIAAKRRTGREKNQ